MWQSGSILTNSLTFMQKTLANTIPETSKWKAQGSIVKLSNYPWFLCWKISCSLFGRALTFGQSAFQNNLKVFVDALAALELALLLTTSNQEMLTYLKKDQLRLVKHLNMTNAPNAVDLDRFCSKFLKSWQKIARAGRVGHGLLQKMIWRLLLLLTFCTKFQQEHVRTGKV